MAGERTTGTRRSLMDRRPIGRTGLEVTTLGLGGAPMGDLFARLDDMTAIATVYAALENGIGLFDTAPHYGNGLGEHRFGTGLRAADRAQIVISTKVGRWMSPMQPAKPVSSAAAAEVFSPGFAGGLPHTSTFDYSYDGAMKSIEQSLLRLGLDRIDILLIHDVDVWTHGADYEARFAQAMAGSYKAIAKLRSEGVVKAIGVGINESAACERFAREGDFDVIMLAGRYTLLEQGALESFLPLAQTKGISILSAGAFNSGILASDLSGTPAYNYKVAAPDIIARARRIDAVCRAHGVPMKRAALQFPLKHPAIVSVVTGAVTPAEITDNAQLLSQPVPASLWSDLKAEGLLRADAPV